MSVSDVSLLSTGTAMKDAITCPDVFNLVPVFPRTRHGPVHHHTATMHDYQERKIRHRCYPSCWYAAVNRTVLIKVAIILLIIIKQVFSFFISRFPRGDNHQPIDGGR